MKINNKIKILNVNKLKLFLQEHQSDEETALRHKNDIQGISTIDAEVCYPTCASDVECHLHSIVFFYDYAECRYVEYGLAMLSVKGPMAMA